MPDYGQFCTVARGAEVFGEMWTPLVIRELLCGSRRFNEIRRGVPRMSQTLADKAPAQARDWASSSASDMKAVGSTKSRRPAKNSSNRRRTRALGRALDWQSPSAEPARCRIPDVGHPPLLPHGRLSRRAGT